MLDNRYFNGNFVAGLLIDIYFPEIFFHWLGMDILFTEIFNFVARLLMDIYFPEI